MVSSGSDAGTRAFLPTKFENTGTQLSSLFAPAGCDRTLRVPCRKDQLKKSTSCGLPFRADDRPREVSLQKYSATCAHKNYLTARGGASSVASVR